MHTHMEIHGIFSLSITVVKAFCNHNSGPRRMYTGNMVKRSLGAKTFEDRGTTVSYSLRYGQIPLISDPVDNALSLRKKEPNGINVNLAVFSDRVNIEDSYIFKKEAIERGLCVSSETIVMTASLGHNTLFQKPDSRTRGKASEDKYDYLLPDGTPKVGAKIMGGMCVIGKVFYKKEGNELKKRCMSRFLPWNEDYTVKSVSRYPNSVNKPIKIIRVSLIKENIPNVGDKYFFPHGQKGTISEIRPTIDMPWYCDGPMAGCAPDVLTNVCSLARITMGLQLEMLWGKARAMNPSVISQYNTVFMSDISFNERQRLCSAVLQENGMKYTGRHNMCLGTTGQMVQCDIFSGMIYMCVLKHMARDKLRSRDRGPTNELTRQTSVGKKHYGGQKEGEMENWNLYCYGMPYMYENINCESADKFLLYMCTKCNIQALGCQESKFYFCVSCKSREYIVRLPNTYITNLTLQELYTAGFGHAIITEKVPNNALVVDEDRIFESHRKK